MKAALSWLGDPFLHLLVIVLVVFAIGSRMTGESAQSDSSLENRCSLCRRVHVDSKSCLSVEKASTFAHQAQ